MKRKSTTRKTRRTRKFGKSIFKLKGGPGGRKKANAKKAANALRKKGKKARVVAKKVGGKKKYLVYAK